MSIMFIIKRAGYLSCLIKEICKKERTLTGYMMIQSLINSARMRTFDGSPPLLKALISAEHAVVFG